MIQRNCITKYTSNNIMLQSRLLMAIITIKVKFLKVMLGDLKFA